MKIILIIFVITPVLFFSCQSNPEAESRKMIIGEWYPLDETNMNGYEFKEDNLCENKLGYFTYTNSKNEIESSTILDSKNEDNIFTVDHFWKNIVFFHGNSTSYKIEEDSLSVYNLSNRGWDKRKLCFLSPDTMILSGRNDSIYETYVRKNYTVGKKSFFDEVYLYLPDAYYPFPIEGWFLSLNCKGKLAYYNNHLDHHFRLFQINENELKRIENSFEKVNMEDIDPEDPDQRTYFIPDNPSITFVRNNQISTFVLTKKRIDNIKVNKEFFWAYISLMYGYSYLSPDICEMDVDKSYVSLFPKFSFNALKFHTSDSIMDLSGSEGLYLRNLINQGTETNASFIPTYDLNNFPFNESGIQTDGRYYRCLKEGKWVTIDIGFDFIKGNDLERYFRRKNDIEHFAEKGEK